MKRQALLAILIGTLLLPASPRLSAEILRSSDGTAEYDFPGWKAVRADSASGIRAERGLALLSINRLEQPKTEAQLRKMAAENLRQLRSQPGRPPGKDSLQETALAGGVHVIYWNSAIETGRTNASAVFNKGGRSYFLNAMDFASAELLVDILPRLGGGRARLFPVSFKALSSRFRNKDSMEDARSFKSSLPEAGLRVEIARRGGEVEGLQVLAQRQGTDDETSLFQAVNRANISVLSGAESLDEAQRKRITQLCGHPLEDVENGALPSAWCLVGRVLANFSRAEDGLRMSYYPAP